MKKEREILADIRSLKKVRDLVYFRCGMVRKKKKSPFHSRHCFLGLISKYQ